MHLCSEEDERRMKDSRRRLTQHRLRHGEGDRRPSGHPPPGRQVGDFGPQHLHDHLVVQGQVELLVVDELENNVNY